MSELHQALQAAFRSSLCAFAERCHAHLFPAVAFLAN
jgi:hypothetical protein